MRNDISQQTQTIPGSHGSVRTKLITPRAFALATGLNYDLVLKLVGNGDIPSVPLGTRRRIDERWVRQWLSGGGATE